MRDEQKKNLKKWISRLINWTVFTLLAFYLYNNSHLFLELKKIKISEIAQVLILQAIFIYLMGITNYLIIKELKVKVKENFQLQVINNFLNKIMPKGGAVYRSVFLKKHYNLNYSKFISSLMGTYIITFISSSIFSLAILLYMYIEFGFKNSTLIILLTTILFVNILISQVNIRIKKEGKIRNILKRIIEGWNMIKEKKLLLLYLIFIAIAGMSIEALRIHIILSAISENIDLYQSFFLSILSFLSMIIAVTPDNIGIREAGFVFFSSSLKISSELIILASLILRAISLIIPFTLGPLFYFKLNKQR